MTELIIVRGIPGSGKSTWARKNFPNHILLEADMYHMKNGEYKWDPTHMQHAHEWCLNTARILLDQGYNVVVANTFVQEWELNRYYNMVRDDLTHCNITIQSYHITTYYGSVHNVPEETLERMRSKFFLDPRDYRVV